MVCPLVCVVSASPDFASLSLGLLIFDLHLNTLLFPCYVVTGDGCLSMLVSSPRESQILLIFQVPNWFLTSIRCLVDIYSMNK